MSVVLHLIDKEEAARKGYSPEDFSAYFDFLATWLETVGVHDFSYGLFEKDGGHPQFSGSLTAWFEPPKDASEELQSFLASMSMTQDMGNWGPYALQNLDSKIMKMVLAAWRLRNDYHRQKLKRIATAVRGAMAEVSHVVVPEA